MVLGAIGTIGGGVIGGIYGGPAGAWAGSAIGGQIGGALDSSAAAERAAELGARSQREALALQREMWETGRADTAPWREFSEGMLPRYSNAMDNLSNFSFNFDPSQVESMPGYQFRLEQGSENMMRGMRTSGLRGSGGMLTSLMEYGQNYASQEYMQEYQRQLQSAMANYGFKADNVNRHAAAAGMGQTSATHGAATAAQVGANMGNNLGIIGQYQAAGTLGQANAWTGAINNMMQFAGNQGWFRPAQQTPTPAAVA